MKDVFDIPVLLLVFNRPDKTQRLFNVIRELRPKFLFVAADGARENNANDSINCAKVREIVKEVNWECEVKYLLRDANLGCSPAITSSISWFFEHTKYGIILEDDCLPDISFFPYCKELLLKYEYTPEIMLISGTNLSITSGNASYYFSRYGQIWGWATWERAWTKYELKVDFNELDNKFSNITEKRFWKRNFKKIIWDVQWAVYSVWKNNGIAILPNTNMVTNIGFGADATNYTQESHVKANLNSSSIRLPLIHPDEIIIDKKTDLSIFYKNYFVPLPLRALDKLKKKLTIK